FALGDGLGVGSDRGRGGRCGDEPAALGGERDLDRILETRARVGELGAAVLERIAQHLLQARSGRRRRTGHATGLEFALEGGHLSTVPPCRTYAAGRSPTGTYRACSSASRHGGRRSRAAWPAVRGTWMTARLSASSRAPRTPWTRWSSSC